MNKGLVSMVLAAVCFGSAAAESLNYKSCNVSGAGFVADMPFIYPLSYLTLSYDAVVVTTEGAKATVRCGESVVADAVAFEVEEYTSSAGKTTSRLLVKFNQTDLPKGESYTITVSPNSVVLASDAEVANEEIVLPFYVPDNLNEYIYNIKANGANGKYTELSFYIGTDVEQASNQQWSLTRNGVTVAAYPGEVKWNDWDLSIGTVKFDPPLSFEKDADYALVIPEGFFCSKYRSDLTNGELILPLYSAESGIKDVVAPSDAQTVYDLQGRKVAKAGKGLYIINGVKTIVR